MSGEFITGIRDAGNSPVVLRIRADMGDYAARVEAAAQHRTCPLNPGVWQ